MLCPCSLFDAPEGAGRTERNREMRYCKKCGTPLEVKLEPTPFEYSEETGEGIYFGHTECPNKEHWWDGHADYSTGRYTKEKFGNIIVCRRYPYEFDAK